MSDQIDLYDSNRDIPGPVGSVEEADDLGVDDDILGGSRSCSSMVDSVFQLEMSLGCWFGSNKTKDQDQDHTIYSAPVSDSVKADGCPLGQL